MLLVAIKLLFVYNKVMQLDHSWKWCICPNWGIIVVGMKLIYIDRLGYHNKGVFDWNENDNQRRQKDIILYLIICSE